MSITSSVTQNKVDVSDVGPSRKKLRIEIPASAVADSLGTSLEALTADAELPGFRRGHVPKRLIEKKFGAGIRKQAKEQLVAQAFQAACDEKKLRVVGAPVDSTLEKLELVDGKPFIFEVEVEVAPEFELPNLEGIKVRKPLAEVTDDLLAAEVKKLCVQEGSLEERQSKRARL
ncbi:MAG: trigger factor family protein [Planctomyces sp.]